MVLKQVAAVAVAAISMLAQRESEGSETHQFSLRWVCRLVPIFVVIPVFRLVINVFVRLIRRCRRVPFLGLICWITGIQFVITVTWVMIRVVVFPARRSRPVFRVRAPRRPTRTPAAPR